MYIFGCNPIIRCDSSVLHRCSTRVSYFGVDGTELLEDGVGWAPKCRVPIGYRGIDLKVVRAYAHGRTIFPAHLEIDIGFDEKASYRPR